MDFGMWRTEDGALRYNLDENYKDVVDYNGEKYIVHPTFETNIDCGGWDKDLPGFWFAKFEMGGTETNLDSTYGIKSLRSQTIGKQYETARKATYGYIGKEETEPENSSIKYTNFMSSHMAKNSEWGAVVYLAHSKYGINGTEVTINETAYYRGGGAGTLAYIENANQSTTGNVYGIYDMSGGAWERVAGFNSVDSSEYLSSNNWTQYTGLTVDSNSTKYATKYKNASGSRFGTNVQYVYGIVGDATKEVLALNIVSGGWFGDQALFANNDGPFFNRGSGYTVGSTAGLFSSSDDNGEINGIYTFRTVLCP